MAQYIDKSALVAEIKSLWKYYLDAQEYDFGWNNALDKVLSYLDTLEVKEVNLKKEQLEELDIVSRGFASSRAEILESLYNDLKKL